MSVCRVARTREILGWGGSRELTGPGTGWDFKRKLFLRLSYLLRMRILLTHGCLLWMGGGLPKENLVSHFIVTVNHDVCHCASKYSILQIKDCKHQVTVNITSGRN